MGILVHTGLIVLHLVARSWWWSLSMPMMHLLVVQKSNNCHIYLMISFPRQSSRWTAKSRRNANVHRNLPWL